MRKIYITEEEASRLYSFVQVGYLCYPATITEEDIKVLNKLYDIVEIKDKEQI